MSLSSSSTARPRAPDETLSPTGDGAAVPKALQAASTLCVLLGSAASVAHAMFWQDATLRKAEASELAAVGGSAEWAAAALLIVSLALEAVAFRRRKLSTMGLASPPVAAAKLRAIAKPLQAPVDTLGEFATLSAGRAALPAETTGDKAVDAYHCVDASSVGASTAADLGYRQRRPPSSSHPVEGQFDATPSVGSSAFASQLPPDSASSSKAHPKPFWHPLRWREVIASSHGDNALVPQQLVFLLLGLAFLMGGFTALGTNVDSVHRLGIVPRTWGGLPGVVFGCFVHLSWRHCGWNAIGLVLLGSCAFRAAFGHVTVEASDGAGDEDTFGWRSKLSTFAGVSAFIAFTSGFCVWCLARPALHAGASGVVCGYVGLLVALTLRRRDVPLGSLLMVLAVVVCYGSAALLSGGRRIAGRGGVGASAGGGFIAEQPIGYALYEACTSRTTSAEHHTFGFLSGLASALFFCQPRSPRKRHRSSAPVEDVPSDSGTDLSAAQPTQ